MDGKRRSSSSFPLSLQCQRCKIFLQSEFSGDLSKSRTCLFPDEHLRDCSYTSSRASRLEDRTPGPAPAVVARRSRLGTNVQSGHVSQIGRVRRAWQQIPTRTFGRRWWGGDEQRGEVRARMRTVNEDECTIAGLKCCVSVRAPPC